MPWMEHLTISSYGSGEDPVLPHPVLLAAHLPQELPQAREEEAPFPGSRPQGGRLHAHCSKKPCWLPEVMVFISDVGSHPEQW
jgi:hypothetical protein